jgi:hypothetical protein
VRKFFGLIEAKTEISFSKSTSSRCLTKIGNRYLASKIFAQPNEVTVVHNVQLTRCRQLGSRYVELKTLMAYNEPRKGGKGFQPFTRSAWGARGRRFESSHPDHSCLVIYLEAIIK